MVETMVTTAPWCEQLVLKQGTEDEGDYSITVVCFQVVNSKLIFKNLNRATLPTPKNMCMVRFSSCSQAKRKDSF